jgi:hypothetical protein
VNQKKYPSKKINNTLLLAYGGAIIGGLLYDLKGAVIGLVLGFTYGAYTIWCHNSNS